MEGLARGGRWQAPVLAIAACTVAWIVAAWVGDLTARNDFGVAAIFLPVGVLVAFMVRFRLPWWQIVLAVLLGDQVIRLVTGGAVNTSVSHAVANAIEVVIVSTIVLRLKAERFERPRDASALIFAALVGCAIGAFLGEVVDIWALGPHDGPGWTGWFLADLLAVILVTPTLIVIPLQLTTPRRLVAFAGLLVGAVVLALVAINAGGDAAVFLAFLSWYLLLLTMVLAGAWYGVPGLGLIQVPAAIAAFATIHGAASSEWTFRQLVTAVMGMTLLWSVVAIREQLNRRVRSERLARGMFQRSPVATARLLVTRGVDDSSVSSAMVLEANAAWRHLLGDDAASEVADMLRYVDSDDRPLMEELLARVGGDRGPTDVRLVRHGRAMPITAEVVVAGLVPSATPRGPAEVLVVAVDVTEQRAAERALEREASVDPLTGLLNRRATVEALRHRLARSQAGVVGVLFVDLDRFKNVNDSLGHAAGDDVLVEVARRLESVVRPGDVVGRLGGDEFVVVAGVDNPDAIATLATRIDGALASGFSVDGHRVPTSGSVGWTVASPADDVDQVLQRADASMYRVKADRSVPEL